MSDRVAKPGDARGPRLKQVLGLSSLMGGLSMTIAQLVTQPGDVLKTIVVQENCSYGRAASKAVSESGIIGLWRGTVPTLWRAMLGGGGFFPAFELMTQLTRPLRSHVVGVDSTVSFINGMGARALAEFATCPLLIVKTEMEYSHKVSTWGALKRLHGRSGVRGMFAGAGPAVSRGAFFSGSYVALYDAFKGLVTSMGVASLYGTTVAAFCASTLGTIITHPFDVVRTHMQLDESKKLSTRQAVSMVLSTRTWRGLFSGVNVKLVKRAVTYSIMWPLYEVLMTAATRFTVK